MLGQIPSHQEANHKLLHGCMMHAAIATKGQDMNAVWVTKSLFERGHLMKTIYHPHLYTVFDQDNYGKRYWQHYSILMIFLPVYHTPYKPLRLIKDWMVQSSQLRQANLLQHFSMYKYPLAIYSIVSSFDFGKYHMASFFCFTKYLKCVQLKHFQFSSCET